VYETLSPGLLPLVRDAIVALLHHRDTTVMVAAISAFGHLLETSVRQESNVPLHH
jgi:hypothetical protein